jgi:hypothetical protein
LGLGFERLANVCNLDFYLILKFLRGGKVPLEGTEFSCHDEAFKVAGISPVITSRKAV